jgi:hypothetical protein
MSIKKIQQALYNADLALNEQIQGPGGSGPWDPYSFDPDMSHAPWFPWWLLPGAPSSDILWDVWEVLVAAFPTLQKILEMSLLFDDQHHGSSARIDNMQAIIRAIMNPHAPSRFLRGPVWNMLRQWMMENLNFIQEILAQFSHLFEPMAPGYESDAGFTPFGPSKPLGDIDTGDPGTDSILNFFRIIDKFTPGSVL